MDTCRHIRLADKTSVPSIEVDVDQICCSQEQVKIAIVVVISSGSCGITYILRNPRFSRNCAELSLAEVIEKGASSFTVENKNIYISIIIKIGRECFSRRPLHQRRVVCVRCYKGLLANVGEPFICISFIRIIPIHRNIGSP